MLPGAERGGLGIREHSWSYSLHRSLANPVTVPWPLLHTAALLPSFREPEGGMGPRRTDKWVLRAFSLDTVRMPLGSASVSLVASGGQQ